MAVRNVTMYDPDGASISNDGFTSLGNFNIATLPSRPDFSFAWFGATARFHSFSFRYGALF
jgi:hypothetical protein